MFDGKVVFVQGTGGLTVLQLESGKPLIRKLPDDSLRYAGTLHASPAGVLMADYDRIVLLDRDTFEPIWTIRSCFDPAFENGWIVSHNGYNKIQCHSATTSQLLWTASMEGGWRIVTAKGKAVVATPAIFEGRSEATVIDLATGNELLRMHARNDDTWPIVYFDGDALYIASATANASIVDPTVASISKYDLDGHRLATIDYASPEIVADYKPRLMPFVLEGHRFLLDGSVRSAYQSERAGKVPVTDLKYDLVEYIPSGVILEREVEDSTKRRGAVLRLESADGSWEHFLPYLRCEEDEWIDKVLEIDGRLLIGSSAGHLECLDVRTGEAKWLYVFPSYRRLLSFSRTYIGNYHRSYLDRQAEIYRLGLSKLGEDCGSVPLPEGFEPELAAWADIRNRSDYQGRILVDPAPDDPSLELSRLRLRAAACSFIPLMGLLLLFLVARPWRSKSMQDRGNSVCVRVVRHSLLAGACLILMSLSVFGLFAYGRVGVGWTLSLVVASIIPLAGANYWLSGLSNEENTVLTSALVSASIGLFVLIVVCTLAA